MTTHPSESIASPSELLSTNFNEMSLSSEVLQAIAQMGFELPTPVQTEAIPVIMSGSDMIAMAQTGTGKTAAFGIPLAEKLDPKGNCVQALVLVPTRELALQVTREITAIGVVRGIRPAAVYGGASFTTQVSEVSSGAQVVVGTPGRVLDHMRRGTIKFSGVHKLVLDEADEMLSMGFEKEISEIIEGLPSKRQTLLFSATIPSDIQRLAQRYMGEPTVVSLSGDDVAAKEIEHYVYLVSGQGRTKDLLRVIGVERPDNAIVFCNTREETQTVARALKTAGFDAEWINSDLSQSERERVMSLMRAGNLKFLVATDVAARGIDISLLGHVINYTFPESLEVYIHRTGRTGRMGRRGAAISLIAPQDIGNLYYLRLTYKIRTIEKQLPDERQEQLAIEFTRFDALRGSFSRRTPDDFTKLARRVSQSIHGEAILAGLLAERFFANAEQTPLPRTAHWVDEVTAPKERFAQAREAAKVEQSEDDAARGRRRKRPVRVSGDDDVLTSAPKPRSLEAKAEPYPPPSVEAKAEPNPPPSVEAKAEPNPLPSVEAKAEPETKDAPQFEESSEFEGEDREVAGGSGEPEREIYIDAGRKDGVRISQLMKDLVDSTGLPRSSVGRVRMMGRATFIKVPLSAFDAVMAALGRIEVDGRKLRAEPAKE
ncbi:MAG: DEAD/DEAH box helicase [Myxococcota bacterium]|jgi:ATP-dependent RNA helicase DeaD|nr:DEAD/DEAH box helicase [Myxococcota bacterium]